MKSFFKIKLKNLEFKRIFRVFSNEKFSDLQISNNLKKFLNERNFETMTNIQAKVKKF